MTLGEGGIRILVAVELDVSLAGVRLKPRDIAFHRRNWRSNVFHGSSSFVCSKIKFLYHYTARKTRMEESLPTPNYFH